MKQNIKKLSTTAEDKNSAAAKVLEALIKKGRKTPGGCPEL